MVVVETNIRQKEACRLVQVERRKWRTEQKEWLEEQLPKATGRSGPTSLSSHYTLLKPLYKPLCGRYVLVCWCGDAQMLTFVPIGVTQICCIWFLLMVSSKLCCQGAAYHGC